MTTEVSATGLTPAVIRSVARSYLATHSEAEAPEKRLKASEGLLAVAFALHAKDAGLDAALTYCAQLAGLHKPRHDA